MEIKMRAAIRKIITIDKQDKPSTQKELGDVLSSEDRFTWLRDLEITKIGAEVFREFWNVVLEENGEKKKDNQRN